MRKIFATLLATLFLLTSCFPLIAFSKDCSSDYSCGYGNKCVKERFKSNGVCMKSVNEQGIRNFDPPSSNSVGPNMDMEGSCRFNTDCPVTFKCDRKYKVCVKK
jgi:hypothetical protein